MAEVSTFRCDECGKLKQDANHWFRATEIAGPCFVIRTWEDPTLEFVSPDEIEKELHLCGMGCAVKAMTKAMGQSG
jgi:hypothetical protein